VGHHEISSTAFSAGPVFSNSQANAFYLAVDCLVHEKTRVYTLFEVIFRDKSVSL